MVRLAAVIRVEMHRDDVRSCGRSVHVGVTLALQLRDAPLEASVYVLLGVDRIVFVRGRGMGTSWTEG